MTNRSYTTQTLKDLMLLSGGRCELCKKPIIQKVKSKELEYKYICEIAHIYGLNEGSPRYDKDIDQSELNDSSNLMVMCPSCHKKIDKDSADYSVDDLKKIKCVSERETVQDIMALTNSTNIGGHINYKNGKKLLNYLREDAPENNEIFKLDSLDQLNNLNDSDYPYEKMTRKLVLSLNDLIIDSRTALLILSKVINNPKDYKLTYSYWESAYGDDIKKVLNPLCINRYIDLSPWKEENIYDNDISRLSIGNEWITIINFLTENHIPFEKLIIQRDYSIFDE